MARLFTPEEGKVRLRIRNLSTGEWHEDGRVESVVGLALGEGRDPGNESFTAIRKLLDTGVPQVIHDTSWDGDTVDCEYSLATGEDDDDDD